ncbi:MAG: hypothetical protein IIA59_00295 [Candidatus Marinimicrobia bacterium]|nr:hypothetical protein [Candidatus Neomarinimicrobiota bacterium]
MGAFRLGGYLLGIMLAAASLQAQTASRSIPPPRYLTDEESLRILLHRMTQGIKQQDLFLMTDGLASVVFIDDSTTATRGQYETMLRTAFDGAESRRKSARFQELTPPGANLTGTWDFTLEIDTVRILADGTAEANAWIYFATAEPDPSSEWPLGVKRKVTVRFQKVGGEWRIFRMHALLAFISSAVN